MHKKVWFLLLNCRLPYKKKSFVSVLMDFLSITYEEVLFVNICFRYKMTIESNSIMIHILHCKYTRRSNLCSFIKHGDRNRGWKPRCMYRKYILFYTTTSMKEQVVLNYIVLDNSIYTYMCMFILLFWKSLDCHFLNVTFNIVNVYIFVLW